jgi:hypothetical protein
VRVRALRMLIKRAMGPGLPQSVKDMLSVAL